MGKSSHRIKENANSWLSPLLSVAGTGTYIGNTTRMNAIRIGSICRKA